MSRFAPRGHSPKMTWEEYYPLHKPTVRCLTDLWGGEITDITAGGDVTVTRPDGKRFFFQVTSKTVIWEEDGGTLFSIFANAYERQRQWVGYALPASAILEHGFCSTLAAEYLAAKNLEKSLEDKFFQEAQDLLSSLCLNGVFLWSTDSKTRKVTINHDRDFSTCPIEEIEPTAKDMVDPLPQPRSTLRPKPKLKAR